jgi:uncharacterized NAD(P)/FAD-binding protein YdhS
MLSAARIAIVGGGFTGTLLAINLLRYGTPHVTLIERDTARLGRGVAYGRVGTEHVLNVRATNMSAFPDEPDHFIDWLARRGSDAESQFATREAYGLYLVELLEEARRAAAGRLAILPDRATGLAMSDDGASLTLASGDPISADIVILASGNLPPHDLPAFEGLAGDSYRGNPWSGDVAQGLRATDDVLLLGNGLTAIDSALTLAAAGFEGRLFSLSRRGLTPHGHVPDVAFAPRRDRPPENGSALVRAVRRRARDIGWRNAIDELRPFTPDLWRAANEAGRARFLRHLRPYWDVHRHRLAPRIAAQVAHLRAQGRLTILAGKIIAATPAADGLAIDWRPRGETVVQTFHVRRVINCTGPLGDLRRTDDALLAQLRDDGLIRPDTLAIGIDVDREGRAIAQGGTANPRLFVAGPMTRGAHWEIVAVPDIRKQVWDLARYLTHSHWVGAEGL